MANSTPVQALTNQARKTAPSKQQSSAQTGIKAKAAPDPANPVEDMVEEAAQQPGNQTEETPPVASTRGGSVLVLTNCTDSPRGIAFKKGIVILQGREVRRVPDDEQAEVRAMFKSRTFQRFVDNGIFRLAELSDDEESVVVPTPAPPAGLDTTIQTSTERPVSTSTGPRATAPTVVEHQAGGPLPVQE